MLSVIMTSIICFHADCRYGDYRKAQCNNSLFVPFLSHKNGVLLIGFGQ